MNKKRHKLSLKWGLLTSILVCWCAAVFIVITIAGALLNYNFQKTLTQTVNENAEGIINQMAFRLTDCMESSKKISYDGDVRNAYHAFRNDGDNIALYRSVTQYLSTNFSRDAKFEAVFISFWDSDIASRMYVINKKNNSYQILQHFIREVRPLVMERMENAETSIQFLAHEGALYMCRNLLNSSYVPYATVTMRCDLSVLLQPLQAIASMGETIVHLDDLSFVVDEEGYLVLFTDENELNHTLSYAEEADGHPFAFSVRQEAFHIWKDLPGLRQAALLATVLVIPLLGAVIFMFSKSISRPVERLVDASVRVSRGERGFCIDGDADTSEFQMLYDCFNSMSLELKEQFEKSKLEQEALQEAKIRALQSQINPHFLNNTLEVINWETRMAGADNASEMLDALSIMLEAALSRDGIGTIPLKREIGYADAYLVIIQKRLGERFIVNKNIDEQLLDVPVPKLILQPLLENAVNHDIVRNKGGRLCMNIYQEGDVLVLKVLHEGHLSDQDKARIEEELSAKDTTLSKGRHVGLKNVALRLRLLYGKDGLLKIYEDGGLIYAVLCLPIH